MKSFIILLVTSLLLSCQSQRQNDLYPVIHLNPDEAGTLNMSDYFDGYKVIHLRDAICNSIQDYTPFQDKYLTLVDQGVSNVFHVFDREGKSLYQIGDIGRGPGEYLNAGRDLILDRDSNILLIAPTQQLKYNIEGSLVDHRQGFPKQASLGSPKLFLNDSILIYYKPHFLRSPIKKLLKNPERTNSESYLLTFQETTGNQECRSFFPDHDLEKYDFTPRLYQYKDSCYFYFDADPYIYHLTPQGPIPYYRIDKGRFSQTKLYQVPSIPTETITIYALNESHRYLWGEYLFIDHHYLFFYDKTTGITQNYKHLNNDYLQTDQPNRYFPERYHTELKHKIQCDPDYQYYFYPPMKFKEIIEYAHSHIPDSEWQEYCRKNPELIRVYEEIDEDSNLVVIGYHFK